MSSSPKTYKLIYFNVRALAENSRMLFKAAGVEFEDFRYPIEFTEGKPIRPEWDNDKSKYLFGKVPVLELDGGKSSISQSHAIERYLATEFKLIGDTHIEAAQIDSVGEQINDLKQAYTKAKESNDVKKFFEEDLQRSFQAFNKLAETVGSNGFIVGKKLSLADIQLYNFCQSFDDQASVAKALESAKALKAAVDNVPQNPNLKKWIAERPKTQF
ncbi:unnamed protein product [Didymodactylos carnosus]|uniref:glutathione transferase n=1 Tax=Didymodactylos carnosus TaxID=1234261 RepID=A0A815VTX6_9BILA|nr:unnamed protein product [Didymodactylos carnosus]CAF1534667.1 unnamed protein product [Didymodactylos carnosus]CAF4252711.1 unnamed protein product [Didymodactylos carnosus]CAF4394412.1 unnamed protein product [Didymodactylos carnosus]